MSTRLGSEFPIALKADSGKFVPALQAKNSRNRNSGHHRSTTGSAKATNGCGGRRFSQAFQKREEDIEPVPRSAPCVAPNREAVSAHRTLDFGSAAR